MVTLLGAWTGEFPGAQKNNTERLQPAQSHQHGLSSPPSLLKYVLYTSPWETLAPTLQ